ncbi:MAG: hypothetical protein Q9219_001088 [cf. Caloplaca sp. 3 TL-2023]
MAPTKPEPNPSILPTPEPQKLPRLPPTARIQKRPLLRPPLPSPYASASQQKVIYISAHTPFISAVKRVRKLFSLAEKRALGSVKLVDSKASDKQKIRELERAVKDGADGGKKGRGEEVVLKATNRAIEKALGLGVFFQGQEDCRVRLRTGSLGVVDDVVVEDEKPLVQGKKKKKKGNGGEEEEGGKGKDERDDVEMRDEEAAEREELPETRIRKVSVLEVGISLK